MGGMFTLAELDQAHERVARDVPRTPSYAWPLLAERLGCETWVKHENLTPCGAFKVRGGLVYLADLVENKTYGGGLITATRGNHGQSIPFAARQVGIRVTVVVPEGNSFDKNRAMLGWGAELRVFGKDFDEAREQAFRWAEEENLTFAPSFDPRLVRGVATYAREFFADTPELDAVYVPIGLGSGICGLIRTRDLLGLKTEIIGVVSTEAPAYALSFEAGEVITTETAETFVDGIACRVPDPEALAIIRAGASRIVRVSDEEVAGAMRAYFDDTHHIAEPAGAAPLAAALQERDRLSGKRIGLILCGGNVDRRVFREVLDGKTPLPNHGQAFKEAKALASGGVDV